MKRFTVNGDVYDAPADTPAEPPRQPASGTQPAEAPATKQPKVKKAEPTPGE